mmetsp:Transcript_24822/g.41360  ORF Transcript_24822/g.41360 Transcript_24822/m.41360 type:complete len:948 (+) Transcript_24822:195-3038(+)
MGDRKFTAQQLKNMQIMIANFCRLENGTLVDDIDLRQYGFESGEIVNNVTVQELCAVHQAIVSLDLTFCKEVSDVGVWAIAKHLIKLHKLVLHGCDLITNVGVRSLALRCSRIKHLDMSRCYNIDDISLTILAGGSWQLEELFLQDCDRVTDNGIVRLAQGQGQHLQILDLTGCTNVGEFGDRALREVGANCVQLRELIMTDSKRVEDSAFVALAQGCHHLERLLISGCENVTKKGIKSLFKSATKLKQLKIVGCRKVSDADFETLSHSPLQHTLTSMELNRFEKLTDRGVAAICKALGKKLLNLDVSSCPNLTDYSSMIVGNLCTKLRSLDYSHCGHISDESIHTMAKSMSCLTSLKLDGNPKITTRAIISHIGVELEFVEMATQWLGYQPRQQVENLIQQREQHVLRTKQAVMIQSALRRKFASRIFWERYRSRLIDVVIPIFQAHVRGRQQRHIWAIVQMKLKCHRKAVVIQSKWRRYYALQERVRTIKWKRYLKRQTEMAILLQKRFRGIAGRRRHNQRRNEIANENVTKAREQALREINAIVVQRMWHGHVARRRVARMAKDRQQREHLAAVHDQMARFIQRVVHGKIGRIRAARRRWEIAHWELMWKSARDIQRVYRGHLGRLRFNHFMELFIQKQRNEAATEIQRVYRGYRGRLLAAVAAALRALRIKQQFYAVEMQRYMRGCVGRHHFKVHKELETRRRRQVAAVCLIQRIFRGHKGREARVIEFELQRLDSQARPLILHLKHLEEEKVKLAKTIHRQEDVEKRMSENLTAIEFEIGQCEWTTSKYMDSNRINNTPQRFLTKFLVVRLRDLLAHETDVHKIKYTELQKRRAEMRDLNREIDFTKRELVPLTTGLIGEVKRQRAEALRKRVHQRRDASTLIQRLWRRALVRSALYDENFQYWVIRRDRELSDDPFYYNVKSREVVWQKPIAYKFFGDRYG